MRGTLRGEGIDISESAQKSVDFCADNAKCKMQNANSTVLWILR